MGVLEGLTDLSTSRNLEILPTVTAFRSGALDAAGAFVDDDVAEAGLNLKYGISSDLTADFTINPDFSQIESDLPQIDVNQRFFFREAFGRLGGRAPQREARRYQVTHVPALIRSRDRVIGVGEPVLPRYERIAFEKPLLAPPGKPLAAFVCPGHPLLDAVIDITLDRHRDLFKRRVVSKRVLYVEFGADGEPRHLHYAPLLDYRPLAEEEPAVDALLKRPERAWIDGDLEQKAQAYAVAHVVPEHLREVREARLALISKTEAAVKDRLTKEISFWDSRAEQLKLDEEAGKTGARLNSGEAGRREDTLQLRLQKRLAELKRDAQISPRPPVVPGGRLVVPRGLIDAMAGRPASFATAPPDTLEVAARARATVMETERRLGFEPTDREFDKLGYDIESHVPATGTLRFIEVKRRRSDAETVTVTRNEILYSLNKPDDFILAIVEFRDDDTRRVHYVRQPFQREPDFDAASVNYTLKDLLARAEAPR